MKRFRALRELRAQGCVAARLIFGSQECRKKVEGTSWKGGGGGGGLEDVCRPDSGKIVRSARVKSADAQHAHNNK